MTPTWWWVRKAARSTIPLWYLDLRANPEVEIQVGPERLKAHARDATEEERPGLGAMTGLWPAYNDYQKRTDRQIPVVVSTRYEEDYARE